MNVVRRQLLRGLALGIAWLDVARRVMTSGSVAAHFSSCHFRHGRECDTDEASTIPTSIRR